MTYTRHSSETRSVEPLLQHIWKVLEPAVPDCLKEVEAGVFEARWWTPVPMNEVDMIQFNDEIVILETPYEPENLPGGVAVRFRSR